jgi:SSS family solute:Na+ symporter
MNGLDFFVIGFYIAGMIGLSYWIGRRMQTDQDYYIAGNRLPWYAIGLSTMATQCSTNSLLGAPAFVVATGLVWLQYELAVPLAMLFLMWILLPMYRKQRLISIYEYLERRFGPETRVTLSLIFQFTRSFSTGVTVYGIALVLDVTTGIGFLPAVLLLGVVTIVYDMLGGMGAVVWSDVIQMVVLVAGVLCVGVVVFNHVGGWQEIIAYAPAKTFQTLDFSGHGMGDGKSFAFWPMLIGGFFLYLAYYGCDQSQVQRELSGTGIRDLRYSLFFNGIGRFPLVTLYCGVGVGMAAYLEKNPGFLNSLPKLANGEPNLNTLVPQFVLTYLPHGLIGLVIIALFAAAMSSLDSTINSLSAATCCDVIERFFLSKDQQVPIWVNKVLTVFWGTVCTLFALIADKISTTVIESINKISSLMNGPLLATFLLAIFTRKTRNRPMVVGIVAGFAANFVCWKYFPDVSWLWWNFIGTVVTAAVALILSLIGEVGFFQDTAGIVWQKGMNLNDPGDERSWKPFYYTLAIYSAGLIVFLWIIELLPTG